MGLTSLNAALSGLRIAQQQISVISTNVANVGTPGYTRKILPQSVQSINGVTVGVMPETIIRNVNMNITRDLWSQVSSVSGLETRLDYLNRIQEFHGPPQGELSVAAEIARLQDAFAALSDSPEDAFLLANTVNESVDTARKINDLSNFLNTLRNDAQDEMATVIDRVNDLLSQVAALNDQIRGNLNIGQTTAQLEDQRDAAIQELSGLIEISFFQRGDGVLVVQTNEGLELASDRAVMLSFSPTPLAATTYYPATAAGVYVGDPASGVAFDITARSPGGKLGALIEMRDVTLPQQSAQIDEMAHKLALRLEAQGLMLFTDGSGVVPPDTPPDPFADPPVPVAYVGFAAAIRVNQDIIADNTLLQRGTAGSVIDVGSNEVIRRVLEFGFGDVNYQLATGTIDLRVSLNAPPNNTLQSFLGLSSENSVAGTRNLTGFLSPADLVLSAAGALNPPNDVFRITIEDPGIGVGPVNIDVSIAAIADGAGNFAQDLVDHINNVVVPALAPADQAALTTMDASFTVAPNGQLLIESNADITIDATAVANGMGSAGLVFLGLAEGTSEAQDPYFDIRVGNDDFVRITIEPGDTEADLLAKLGNVPGLAIDLTNFAADGRLRLRPGSDFSNPEFGGDIQIISGPFTTSGAGANAVFGAGTILDGVNVVSSLFGSFSDLDPGPGTIIQNNSPIENINYQSETYVGSGVFVSFREQYLGPGADIETEVIGSRTVGDFSRKMISQQAQDVVVAENRLGDEDSLREILQTQLLNDSGVNLDEELGNLIVVQTAYAAAARVITAVDELFQELLNAVR